MIENMGWLAIFLVSPWFALLAGLVLQVYGTQRVKFWFPVAWSDFRRRRVIEALGLVLGVFPTGLILHAQGHPPYQVAWLAVIVGVAGPVGWKVFSAIVYRARPELEGTLSAHGRARKERNGAC